ncbi:MAG: hypothetical protein WCO12_01795 [bacterium]
MEENYISNVQENNNPPLNSVNQNVTAEVSPEFPLIKYIIIFSAVLLIIFIVGIFFLKKTKYVSMISSDESIKNSELEGEAPQKSELPSEIVVRDRINIQSSKPVSTSSKSATYASTTKAAPLLRHCSKYFNVCMLDPEKKWEIKNNTEKDFDLRNTKSLTSLYFVYSDILKLGDPAKKGFFSVSLLRGKAEVYKSTTNGVTQVMIPTQFDKDHVLVVILNSNKDITASEVKGISDSIVNK